MSDFVSTKHSTPYAFSCGLVATEMLGNTLIYTVAGRWETKFANSCRVLSDTLKVSLAHDSQAVCLSLFMKFANNSE